MAIKPTKPNKPTANGTPTGSERNESRQTKGLQPNRNESRQTKGLQSNRNESRQTKGLTSNRNESRQAR